MIMLKSIVLFLSLLLPISSMLYAQVPEVDECESVCGVSCAGMRISICPAGDFEMIQEGCGGASDYIYIYARDSEGVGIPGIPWTDYGLISCNPAQELDLCYGSMVPADSLTDGLGRTTMSGHIRGSGCLLHHGVSLWIQGKILLRQPLCVEPICMEIQIVSPDLNKDHVIDLSDLASFGQSYNCPGPTCTRPKAFNNCCDYNDDGVCNLSDLALFGQHYQHMCL
jgi:hypothetical protein